MIYTVTFNPSLDYIVDVTDFKTGVVNRTTGEKIFAGGKGINVSMVLKNLGMSNTSLGFTAGFTGNEIKRLLGKKGVNTDFIEVEDGISRINVKLRSNEESEINGQGPVITEDNIKKLYEKLDCLKESDVLVLAGSIPDVMPSSMYMDIMKHLEGRGINIVVDATRNLLTNVLAYKPFLIKPNNHELGEIFGVEITDKDDVIKYAKKLQEQGARNVLVSMAGDGAVLVTEDGQEFKANAPKGKLKNSVGAGDSMVAGGNAPFFTCLSERHIIHIHTSDNPLYYISFARIIQVRGWGARPCSRSTLRPCALCDSILKILCQLLQTAPDAVTDTAWVYILRCGNLAHTHTQVIPGIDPFGLLLRQSHHSGIELLPQLLFLQEHFRCLGL